MFPNFTSLSQRERKRLDLLKQAERNISNDTVKRKAYEEAMWASDVEKNRIALSLKSTTTSTQTDSSTSPQNGSFTDTPFRDARDSRANSTYSDIDDSDIDSEYYTVGSRDSLSRDSLSELIGLNNEPMEPEETSSASYYDAHELHSHAWIKALFMEHPELATAGYNPIRDLNGLPDKTYVIGRNGVIFNARTRRPARRDILETVDWVRTAHYIEALREEHGVNIGRELSAMSMEDTRRILKRKGSLLVKMPEKVRKIVEKASNGSSTSQDESESYDAIKELYLANKVDFDQLEINVIDKSRQMIKGFKLHLTRSGNLVITKTSGGARDNSSVAKDASWVNTLQYLVERLRQVNGSTLTPREEPWVSRADHDTSSGTATQATSDIDSKNDVFGIYKSLPFIDEIQIKPIQNYKEGPRVSDSFYFGPHMSLHSIKTRKAVTGKVKADLLNQINWGLTRTEILNQIELYDDLLSLTDVKSSDQEEYYRKATIRSEIADALQKFKVRAPRVEEGMGLTKIQLQGRGLMGAGAKNLREIEGSGTASDLKYKRLGSKFIRVKDLRENRLKLVYPNRTPVGKLCDIDPKLGKLIDKLVFDKDIDQQLYGQLSIDDKKLFCEILKATHLQHQFSNALEDPIESLRSEFDKLLGQVQLGNDNADLIRELKTMAVDLYSQKLISDDDFKSIILL